jgi:hypothetical protein
MAEIKKYRVLAEGIMDGIRWDMDHSYIGSDAGQVARHFLQQYESLVQFKSITVREVKIIEEQKERPGAAVPRADQKA